MCDNSILLRKEGGKEVESAIVVSLSECSTGAACARPLTLSFPWPCRAHLPAPASSVALRDPPILVLP
eukprot:scaffold1529_cov33-Tisochrysis_lutea.AAC.4